MVLTGYKLKFLQYNYVITGYTYKYFLGVFCKEEQDFLKNRWPLQLQWNVEVKLPTHNLLPPPPPAMGLGDVAHKVKDFGETPVLVEYLPKIRQRHMGTEM